METTSNPEVNPIPGSVQSLPAASTAEKGTGEKVIKVQYRGKGPVVKIYQRKTPAGNVAYMVSNTSQKGEDGSFRRVYESFKDLDAARGRAEEIAKALNRREFLAASITGKQALEYSAAVERLARFPGVSVDSATSVVADCLDLVGTLSAIRQACKDYKLHRKEIVPKLVSEVVKELLTVKKARTKKGRPGSDRYINDLDGRLERFANDFKRNLCDIQGSDIQAWLEALRNSDGSVLSPGNYRNYRTVINTLFSFGVTRRYAAENPVAEVEKVAVADDEDISIFTPEEMRRLLVAAQTHYPDFLACLAIGAFAGLRSAEIERLQWSDFRGDFIELKGSKTKTKSRRLVPIHPNLRAWLEKCPTREGKVWNQSSILFYKRQESVARVTEVKPDAEKGIKAMAPVTWKANALRHSYASYRFAQLGDAGRVAGEIGNSAAMVFKHYRELVRPADAEKWFGINPEEPSNVVVLPSAAAGA